MSAKGRVENQKLNQKLPFAWVFGFQLDLLEKNLITLTGYTFRWIWTYPIFQVILKGDLILGALSNIVQREKSKVFQHHPLPKRKAQRTHCHSYGGGGGGWYRNTAGLLFGDHSWDGFWLNLDQFNGHMERGGGGGGGGGCSVFFIILHVRF